MNKTPGWPPRNIYDYAYAQGQAVIAPKRHSRHAVEMVGVNFLEQDFARASRGGINPGEQTYDDHNAHTGTHPKR